MSQPSHTEDAPAAPANFDPLHPSSATLSPTLLSPPVLSPNRPFLPRDSGSRSLSTYGEFEGKSNRASRLSFFSGGGLSPPFPTRRGSQVSLTPLGDTAKAIQSGSIGGSYGPYPHRSSISGSSSTPSAVFSRRASNLGSDVAVDLITRPSSSFPTPAMTRSGSELELPRLNYGDAHRLSASWTSTSLPPFGDLVEVFDTHQPPTETLSSLGGVPRPQFLSDNNAAIRRSQLGIASLTVGNDESRFMWEKGNEDADDYLHEAKPELEALLDKEAWKRANWMTVADTTFLVIVVLVILGLFLGWPVLAFGILGSWKTAHQGVRPDLGFGPGGINGSGQVPDIPNLPSLVDKDTPLDAYSMTGHDGETLNLVFSDEFNRDGRTFWPGDDPYWEAVDLHYWATQDYEWYDPDAITTKDGKLEITLTQEPIHDLNFRSGMLQSWNKFCFTGGRIEVSCSFPGTPTAMGYWPGVWTMGNLGRAGYGGSNHGMWPYSYTSCDVGTLPNQTNPDGATPTAARQSGLRDYGGQLSYLPGQRASACTCEGEDHPGPHVGIGRGAPEIDVTEQQVDWRGTGSTSQSIQFAPMDAGYAWKNTTPEMTIYNTTGTVQNLFTGAVNQESASLITLTDTTSYDGKGYSTFSFEYEPGPDGRITWFVNNTPSWQINAAAMGPNAETEIGQRLISVEPMSINLNLAISNAFQSPNWAEITFPGVFRIDYVRVYQKGTANVGCDPPDYPTSAYIKRNLDVYTNPNLTTYPRPYPKNRLSATGCA